MTRADILWNVSKAELNQRLHAWHWREGMTCTSAQTAGRGAREHARIAAKWRSGALNAVAAD